MMAVRTPTLDRLAARVERHPFATVGGAFLVGSWFALEAPRAHHGRTRRAALALFSAVAGKVARELVVRQLRGLATA
jgi:hypothetical protein